MTTATAALQERVAEELYYEQYPEGRRRSEWPDAVHPETVYEYRDRAAAVLPIIAEEVRKGKAEAWDDSERSLSRWFIDSFAGDEPPHNPYRETGDQR